MSGLSEIAFASSPRHERLLLTDIDSHLRRAEQLLRVLVAHRKGKPRPDFDPRVDYPERYTEGPV